MTIVALIFIQIWIVAGFSIIIYRRSRNTKNETSKLVSMIRRKNNGIDSILHDYLTQSWNIKQNKTRQKEIKETKKTGFQ